MGRFANSSAVPVLYFSDMNRYLKTLLIWILIAVIPLHAVAATVGMSCAPGHQQAISMAAAASGAHAMSQGDNHHHASTDRSSSLAHDPADSAALDEADVPPAAHSTCSACTAFCIGAVAPPSVNIAIPSFSGSENVVVSAAPSITGFIPDGLRRPPRQIST
jgi:hypothetical protein